MLGTTSSSNRLKRARFLITPNIANAYCGKCDAAQRGEGGGANATAPTPSPTYQGTQHAAAPFAQLATAVKLTVVSSSRTRCRAIARRVQFATVMGSVPTEDMWGCCAIVGVSSEGLRGLMCNSGRVRKVRQRRKQKSPHGCGPQNPATEMRTWRSLTYIHATQRK